MNPVLAAWNESDENAAIAAMLACCGATRWARVMVALRPLAGANELKAAADSIWATMQESDWLEAFACHPRIGERKAVHATDSSTTQSAAQYAAWSRQEQSSTATAADSTLAAIAAGNVQYEKLFGFTYIVCATGKSADEMLVILQRRLASDRAAELREAAEQQRQITQIRLIKWLAE
jgi:2-oxo-4-hydroxy-4-carboxy-5-ureidoimidazoline decarboxylase